MKKLVGLTLAGSVWLSGCAGFAQDRLYRDYAARSLSRDAAASYVTLTTALQAGQGAEGQDAPLVAAACFAPQLDATKVATCTAQRNQAIAALVIGSEELCVEHRKTIYGNEASWNISLGTLTNLFAGAAAVSTTETSKTLLAALALFSNSERSLINETVYKQMLITAVDRKIVELRDTRMQTVYVALKQDINAYSMHEALRDVLSLHSSCSFMNGLQKALEEGTQAGAAQRILRLKASLQSATTELAAVSALPVTEQAGRKPYTDGLAARISAISSALAAEEVK